MKNLTLALIALVTLTTTAQGSESDAQLVAHIQQNRAAAQLDGRIKASIQLDLAETFGEFPLKDFAIQWSTLRCVSAEGWDAEVAKGSCLVEAGAFQVAATVALIAKSSGAIEISVVEAAVE